MTAQSDNIIIDRSSLHYLFSFLKVSKDEKLFGEIYSRTYSKLFHYIDPKVSVASDTSTIIQMVYRILFTTQLANEQEQNIVTYLERLADGCLLLHNSSKSITYA